MPQHQSGDDADDDDAVHAECIEDRGGTVEMGCERSVPQRTPRPAEGHGHDAGDEDAEYGGGGEPPRFRVCGRGCLGHRFLPSLDSWYRGPEIPLWDAGGEDIPEPRGRGGRRAQTGSAGPSRSLSDLGHGFRCGV